MAIPKIYLASKMQHAERWRQEYVRKDVHIVSRWPFLEPSIDCEVSNCRKFWQDDVADIQSADAVVVYAEEGEKLRGALVEAGIAIGLGKLVIVVGEHPDYGTWSHHPLVKRATTLDHAFAIVAGIVRG
jgi:nucleoside 2-deoxyribosyltransferase